MPIFVRNNEPGTAAKLLERYGERSWNNPVVRFFSADGKELLERRDGVYRADALTERLVQALEAAGEKTPPYLALARAELRQTAFERAVFAMT